MLSEEEKIIEDIKEIINKCKECKFATCEQCEINWTQIKTVEHLLELYQKEKEKNKEQLEALEEWINGERISQKCINKDKIKAKIEEYKTMYNNLSKNPREHMHSKIEYQIVIGVLQELLEE